MKVLGFCDYLSLNYNKKKKNRNFVNILVFFRFYSNIKKISRKIKKSSHEDTNWILNVTGMLYNFLLEQDF